MKKAKYIYSGFCFLGVILFFIFYPYFLDNKRQKEEVEYPSIYSSSFEFKGIIVKRSISTSWKGLYLFTLSNDQKFSGEHISFLQIGDSIYKPQKLDSLYIFSKGMKSVIPVK